MISGITIEMAEEAIKIHRSIIGRIERGELMSGVEDTGKRVKTGFVEAHVWRVKEEDR